MEVRQLARNPVGLDGVVGMIHCGCRHPFREEQSSAAGDGMGRGGCLR